MALPIILAIIKNMEIPSVSWYVTLTLVRLWTLAVIPESSIWGHVQGYSLQPCS